MGQDQWRFCRRCAVMFFNGAPSKGACAAGGAHEAEGLNFDLPFDVPETPTDQGAWRFCEKCESMFFDGRPDKGVCPVGEGEVHRAQGLVFVLPHDVRETPGTQRAWRFCMDCAAMFYNGRPDKGVCPTGNGHRAEGFRFVLPFGPHNVVSFESGRLASDLPLGGSAHLVVQRNGHFTFSTHAHDSGFDNIRYVIGAVLMSPTGIAFTFAKEGRVEGEVAGLPFGTPRRDDDFIHSAVDPNLATEFELLASGGRFLATLTGVDLLAQGVNELIQEMVKELAQEGVKAVIALIAA